MTIAKMVEKPVAGLEDDDQPKKRTKLMADVQAVECSERPSSAFRTKDFLKSVASSLKLDHDQSGPYRHAVLQNIFDEDLLRNARAEIKTVLSFTPKETDIYKVFQTGDLANLDGLSEEESGQLESVKQVRDSLYSQEFRVFLDAVTSCGPLSGKQTDMSINDYRLGCHLLNHDDVIGTRRLSYILYLTDPDKPWQSDDGGALELYPVDPETHQPLATPAAKIVPTWNQFVFFVVQPGQSFHSVEEVFNPKKSRLSISGWFHLPHEDEPGYEEGRRIKAEEEKKLESLGASLEQLKGKSDDVFCPIDPIDAPSDPAAPFTPEDILYLSQYIDPSFLKPSDIGKLKDRFVQDSHISLMEFLEYRFSCQLKRAILLNEAKDLESLAEVPLDSKLYPQGYLGPRFEFGLHDKAWQVTAPPHKHRYLRPAQNFSGPASAATSKLLELQQLLQSRPFLKWLNLITTCVPVAHSVSARRFRPGLDYTLATSSEQQLLELHLSLTPALGWDDGELGGWECYMASTDEEQADPAVYKAPKQAEADEEEDAALLTVYPSWNKLELVLRDAEILTFTKYVSFRSTQSKWDVKGVYQIEEDDAEDDEAVTNGN